MFKGVLIEGAIGGGITCVIAFLLSRFTRDIAGRAFLVMLLFAATGAYFGFALKAEAGLQWVLIELAQVIGFGVMALLSLRGSPQWLSVAWLLHPVWDVALHYRGPGKSFAPWTYTIACLSFDLAVAAYILLVYRLVGAKRIGFRGIKS